MPKISKTPTNKAKASKRAASTAKANGKANKPTGPVPTPRPATHTEPTEAATPTDRPVI